MLNEQITFEISITRNENEVFDTSISEHSTNLILKNKLRTDFEFSHVENQNIDVLWQLFTQKLRVLLLK